MERPHAVPARKGRARRQQHTRNVGAQVAENVADEFLLICDRQGVSCASVVRDHVIAYVEAHRDQLVTPDQRELPMTG